MRASSTKFIPLDEAPTTNTDTPVVIGLVVLAVLAAAVWYLNSPAPVEVADAEVSADGSLTAIVNSCRGDLTIDVDEDDSLVRIRVFDHRFRVRFSGDDCQDVVDVPLSVPLGDRGLIDAFFGTRVPVTVID